VNQDVLNGLIRPQNVAIIGASATPGKIGHTVVKNLIEGGYKGGIYPVNPDSEEILGKKVYKSVKDIPGPVDAAIITIPAKYVSPVIDECGVKGVKGLIVITSGFSEVGRKDLEEEMVQKAHQYGMCVLGPNIVGTLSNADKFNGSFAPFLPLPGKSSLVTQSGALLIAIDAASFTRRVGFEKLISIGNVSDVGFADLVTWLNDDPATFCISLYIEGLKDGRDFIEAGKKAKKPIIALKSGVSSHGAAAAASHTGSLAGAAKIYSAAFQQAGVIQAQDLNDLFNRTQVLSLQPPMKGEKLLVLTNGGGVGVLATDAAEKYGLPLMFAPDDVQEELRKHMPDFGSAKNPVDMTGMAGNEWYRETTQYSFAHPWVDGLCVLYCETAMTDPQGIAESIKAGIDATGIKDKPVTVSFVGGERSDNAMRWLVENGIPAYGAPDLAVNAMACLREYARFKEIAAEPDNRCDNQDKTKALAVIEAARKEGRDSLTEIEAKQVFAAYDLPVTKIALAKTEDEAVELASKTGFPVVMKIVSPDILHKSDAGGVKVNVKDEAGVRDTWKTIMANVKAYKPEADIHGIAIQEMAPWGTEVILGSINDASFGPTIMFGLGGIFVEVLKDVTFRVTPVTQGQARRMLSEIRGAPILKGARGEPPRDQVALVETICKFSNMILDLKDEISETDANPLLVYEEGKGLKVADARVILKPKE
jgi:acetyl coenzyme A synthetase (ADP forming)-like protein